MTLFAALMAGGVVMGMLALSVDVGSIMFERRQLQNAADATALALAENCAVTATSCTPATVSSLLAANAKDNTAQYDSRADATGGACGRATGSALPDCNSATTTSNMANLKDCPPNPSWLSGTGATIPYVETYSRTDSGGGSTILPKFFSQTLAGGGPNASVTACARAAWGPPGSYTGTVPLTLSSCEWKQQTNNGSDWVTVGPTGAKPGYGPGQSAWPSPSKEIVILLHNPNDEANDCDWNGKDTAGGFGWVDSTNCSATVTTDNWAQIDTGNNTPTPCKDLLPGLVGTTVSLPVFDCMLASKTAPTGPPPSTPIDICDPTQKQTSGNGSWYHIAGWAKFYVSGYRFSGGSAGSILPGGASSCSTSRGSSDRCLMGWFLKGSLDATSIAPPGSSGGVFGTFVVLPAG